MDRLSCLSVWLFGCLAVWLFGCLAVWLFGCLAVWLFGCLAVWLFGCLAVWLFGCLAGVYSAVKPVTNDHPLGPEKAVFSGRWSLVRGSHRTTIIIIMNVRPSVPGEVVCSSRLVASHGGL